MHKLELPASDLRLDQRITQELEGVSRSEVSQAIKTGTIQADPDMEPRLKLKPSLKFSEPLTILYDPAQFATAKSNTTEVPKPQDIPIEIIYEDEDLLVVNKPAGLVVHPSPGHPQGTLVNALLAHGPLSTGSAPDRPGIVHRLDKDTSGLMLVARNDWSHAQLTQLWHSNNSKPTRRYCALVHGGFAEDAGVIEGAIGRDPADRQKQAIVPEGKEALTRFKVLKRLSNTATEVECELETGRMHQIRVHLAGIKHPVYGDPIYGRGDKDYQELGLENPPPAQCLHACELIFKHPRTGKLMAFKKAPPAEYQAVRHALEVQG